MAEYDTAALVEDVKERGSLPANDARFTTAKILSSCTLELREGVAPLLSAARAEHLVYPYTVAVVSGTASYRMPARAVGGTLRNVSFLDTSGNPVRLRELSSDEVEQIGATTSGGTPYAYYLRNYQVVLVPVPNVAGTLSMPYYARPNRLVATTAVARITSVTYVEGALTALTTAAPVSLTSASSFDLIRGSPGFETLGAAIEGTWSTSVTFEATLSEDPGLAAGDYVCLPGEAPVPQVPVELHGLLAARAARRLVKAVGDDRWQALDADVAELEQRARDWLAPRVSGQTQQAGGTVGSSGIGPFGGNWWGW